MSETESFNLNGFDNVAQNLIARSVIFAGEAFHQRTTVWHFMLQVYLSQPQEAQALFSEIIQAGLDENAWKTIVDKKLASLPVDEQRKNELFPTESYQPTLDSQFFSILKSALQRNATLNKDKKNSLASVRDLLTALVDDQSLDIAFKNIGLKQNWGKLKAKWYNLPEPKNTENNMDELESSFDPAGSLAQYCVDLTAQAKAGKFDPIIGRDDEMREAMNILQRRSQNSPIFVGEAGVGKTALVNGLAQRMTKNEVPETMKDKKLLALDVVALSSGVGRSDLDKRVKTMLQELSEHPEVILFIDDIHNLVSGMGEGQAVGQLLKPALARGELRCIGATSAEEYRVYLEKDVALERRFQKVPVLEPSPEDAVAILRGLKSTYVAHHNVEITDEAMVAAVELSSRYIKDRCLPAKAIDLMDGAAARVRTTLDSKPESLDKVERKIIQLKVQRESLKQEELRKGGLEARTQDRLNSLEDSIQSLEEDAFSIEKRWKVEKELHDNVRQLREEYVNKKEALATAENNQDLIEMSTLQHSVLPELEKQLREARRAIAKVENPLLFDQVGPNQVAEVVAHRTGIPVSKMNGDERQKYADMEKTIGSQVMGQAEAVESISDSVRRSRAGLSNPKKPIGSFLFLGPTGVGKTELTKQLTTFLFENENAMVRLDMSEFMEKHSISRLIGPPPGYVGYEEGGMLTEAVRSSPYSVVLLDEVEKAHPDVFNILLQVLDDGHLTDGKGRTVDFKNTVIILTSNLGASDIQDLTAQGATNATIKEAVMEHVKGHFRPEFINRLDETVVFNPLNRDAIANIAQLQVKKLCKRIKDRNIEMNVTPNALSHLVDVGFDPLMGARPLNRAIQNELESPLAKKIMMGEVGDGDKMVVDAVDGVLTWQVKKLEVQLDNGDEPVNDDLVEVTSTSVAQKAAARRKPAAPKRKAGP